MIEGRIEGKEWKEEEETGAEVGGSGEEREVEEKGRETGQYRYGRR